MEFLIGLYQSDFNEITTTKMHSSHIFAIGGIFGLTPLPGPLDS
jgi:hypothetical protein